jgi:hypothetical protein
MSAASPLMFLSAQWAILGVLVVVGLFFVWRRLNAIDEKLESLQWRAAPPDRESSRQQAAAAAYAPAPMAEADAPGEDEYDQEDEDEGGESEDAALMRAIFEQALPIEGGASFVMFASDPSGASGAPSAPPKVTIEEEPSEPGTDAGLSKTRLRKLPVEALKELLASKALSTEGNKNALVQRLADAEGI